ncbi:hypothetical protein BKA65DRAFT_473154 [Rhexocercosporidium sp. MPI-PUGE-AT-0058]|nr:hypothetical protein BKA65DRAFT_473154 [Rhexocercosporidium sp. MPI-PUGE-AT-0058]
MTRITGGTGERACYQAKETLEQTVTQDREEREAFSSPDYEDYENGSRDSRLCTRRIIGLLLHVTLRSKSQRALEAFVKCEADAAKHLSRKDVEIRELQEVHGKEILKSNRLGGQLKAAECHLTRKAAEIQVLSLEIEEHKDNAKTPDLELERLTSVKEKDIQVVKLKAEVEKVSVALQDVEVRLEQVKMRCVPHRSKYPRDLSREDQQREQPLENEKCSIPRYFSLFDFNFNPLKTHPPRSQHPNLNTSIFLHQDLTYDPSHLIVFKIYQNLQKSTSVKMFTPMNDRHIVHPLRAKSNSKPSKNHVSKFLNRTQSHSKCSKFPSKDGVPAASEPEPTLADADEIATIYFTNPLLAQFNDRYVMGFRSTKNSSYGSPDDPLFERSSNPCRPGASTESVFTKNSKRLTKGSKRLTKSSKRLLGQLHNRKSRVKNGAVAGRRLSPLIPGSSLSLERPSTPTTTSDSLLRRSGSMYTFPSLGNPSMGSINTVMDPEHVDADTPTPVSKTRRFDDIMETSGLGSSDFMDKVLASSARSVKSMDNLDAQNASFAVNHYVAGVDGDFPVRLRASSSAIDSADAITNQLSDQSFIMHTIEIMCQQHPLIETELRVLKNAIQKHETNKEVTKSVDEGISNIKLWEKVEKIRNLEERLIGKDEHLTNVYQHVDDLEIRQEVFEKDLKGARKKIADLQTEAMMKNGRIYALENENTHLHSEGQTKSGLIRNLESRLQTKEGRIRQLSRSNIRLTANLHVSRKKLNDKARELEEAFTAIEMLEKTEKEAIDYSKLLKSYLQQYCGIQSVIGDLYLSPVPGEDNLESPDSESSKYQGSRVPKGKGNDFGTILGEVSSALRDNYINHQKLHGKAAELVHGSELLAMIEAARDIASSTRFGLDNDVEEGKTAPEQTHKVPDMNSAKKDDKFMEDTVVKDQRDDEESYKSEPEAEVKISDAAALRKYRRSHRIWNGVYIGQTFEPINPSMDMSSSVVS